MHTGGTRHHENNVMKSNPDRIANVEKLYRKSCKLLDKAQFEAAIKCLDEVIAVFPASAVSHYNRALAHQKIGNHLQAISDYTIAIRFAPNDADSFNNRGLAYAELGEFEKALLDYAEAIRLAPKDPKGFFNQANLYYDKGDYAEAPADYTTATSLDPNNPHVFYNRG